jgi:hypothetical protein
MEKKKWSVSDEYLEKITEAQAKFIHEYSEKQLKEVTDTSNVILTRTSILISVTVASMIGLVGYSVSHWEKVHKFDNSLDASAFGIIYLFIICLLLILNVKPTNYYSIGAEPKVFFCNNFFNESIEKEERQFIFYINEIESYQDRIESNKITNNRRWSLYHVSLWLVGLTPIVLIVAYLTTSLFSCSH